MTPQDLPNGFRWHIPAKQAGISLPPGYAVFQTPLRYVLCFGDDEVAQYPIEIVLRELERAARDHFAKEQAAASTDAATGLPWSSGIRSAIVEMLRQQDLHLICVRFEDFGSIIAMSGYQVSRTALREAVQRLRNLMDGRDHLARHTIDTVLIFTSRSPEEAAVLGDAISPTLVKGGRRKDDPPVLTGRVGFAVLRRAADPDAADAIIDGAILRAEAALRMAPATPPDVEPLPLPETVSVETTSGTAITVERERVTEVAAPQLEAQGDTPPKEEVHTEPPEVPTVALESAAEPAVLESATVEFAAAESPAVEPPAVASSGLEAPAGPLVQTFEPSPAPPNGNAGQTPAEVEAGDIRIASLDLDISGLAATATVRLAWDRQEASGRAVGRNAEARRPLLVAEATARAMTDLLPSGFGLVIEDVTITSLETGQAVWVVVRFLTPDHEETLVGVSPFTGLDAQEAGRSVLNAVSRRAAIARAVASSEPSHS